MKPFFIDEFFIFRLKSVICKKKYANTNGNDSKYTNTIDISSIWLCCRLYWRLFCILYCRLYWRLYWRLYCRMYCRLSVDYSLLCNNSSFLFFISEASLWPWVTSPGCFSRVIIFFASSVIFYLTQNPRGNSFHIYNHACFDFFKKFLATTNSSSVSTSFSSCVILRSPLSFGYHTKMAFAFLLKFFGLAE